MKNLLKILDFIGAEFSLNKLPKKVLWGVAPTGDPHLGYIPYIKLLKYFKSKGSEIILLIANYHGYLDSEKTKWNEIEEKTQYYKALFSKFGFTLDELIETKDIYTKPDYIQRLFQFSRYLPSKSLTEFAERTLKSFYTKDYRFSDLIYVALQIYDVVYFDLDLVLCGIDEAGIYKLGLPIIKENLNKKVDFIYLPMVPGVLKEEMHASDPQDNKILLKDIINEDKNILIKDILKKIRSNDSLQKSIKEYILPVLLLISGKIKLESLEELVNELIYHMKKEISYNE